MAWSLHSVHALPSSLNDPGNPRSTLCRAKQVGQSGVGAFPNEEGWLQGPVAPSGSSPRPDPRDSGAGPGRTPMDPLSEQEGTSSSGQLESSPPTLCCFLVEQAQALAQWDSGGPACPRDGAHFPPPRIPLPPFLTDSGELLEG